MTSKLIESLASDAPKRREIALIALRTAVPQEVFERVLVSLIKNDESESVRLAALAELGNSAEPSTALSLFAIANDPAVAQDKRYQPSERNAWLVAARTISLRSELPPDSCIVSG